MSGQTLLLTRVRTICRSDVPPTLTFVDEPPSKTLLLNIVAVLDASHPIVLIVIALLVITSALISASEAAFFSLQSKELDRCRRSSSRREQDLVEILEHPQLLLVTLLATNILAKLAIVTISILQWAGRETEWPLRIIIVLITLAIVLTGDLFPKLYGRQKNIQFALVSAQVWKLLMPIWIPVSVLISKFKTLWPRNLTEKIPSADVLDQAKETVANTAGTSEGEQDILKGIANFGKLTVRQVMRNRAEISAINANSTYDELMDFVNKSGFSRIPVYENTLDSIIGVLYIKDLLPFLEIQTGFTWQSLLRPGFFVSETKKIDLLLKDFQEKRVHMAIITGEYGGTTGLVTLEDLIEEIIGEINDEFDEVEHHFKKIDSKTFLFDGKTILRDFCKTLDIEPETFREVKGKSESLGGLIIELKREFPKAGDQINYEQFTFVIESVDGNRIKRVRVIVHEQAP
ncbi:MAG: gliding motility-associated protein GldE [Cyclobacteriaceae bacterium]|nr:gliding motility-associated protein GldE [Cyclobacteriaceae bacterium]